MKGFSIRKWIKKQSGKIFAAYMLVLILVVVLKFPTVMVINDFKVWASGGDVQRMTPQLIPFHTIIPYIKMLHSVTDWFFKNLMVNVVIFMPYGFLVPLFSEKLGSNLGRVVISGALLSLAIEIFQYISALGVCDVDDIILNVLGTLPGYGICRLLYKRFPSP